MIQRQRAMITRGRSVTEMDQILASIDEDNPLAVSLYRKGECPECRGHFFNTGPVGGLSENIRCANCGAKWWIGLPFPPTPLDNMNAAYDLEHRFDLREYFRGEGEA